MTRSALAVLATLACLSAKPASAQFVVVDVANVTRQSITATIKEWVLEQGQKTGDLITKMSDRLKKIQDVRDYALGTLNGWLDVPMSYIKTPLALTASFMDVLQTGGVLVDSVKRVDLGNANLPTESLRSAIVTLDLADGVLQHGADLAGRIRGNGPQEEAAIRRLERDVLDGADSTTAALDTLSGAALIEARQRETREQLLTLMAEMNVSNSVRRRQTDAAQLRMRIGLLNYRSAMDDEGMEGADVMSEALRRRQP